MKRLLNRIKGSPVARRLASGFGANLLGKVWVILIQLLSVPLLTASWGVEGFGLWLMISTISSYLSMSDFGLATAAGIDITRAVAHDDHPAALRAFQTVWLFITAVTCLVAVAVGVGVMVWAGLTPPTEGGGIARNEIAGAVAFVTVGAVFSIQMSIHRVIYQATHRYALGTALNDIAYLLQGFAVIAVALAGGSIMMAAAASAFVAVVMLPVYMGVLARLEPWCHIGIAQADRATLRRLLRPSLAAFILTAANAFGPQGVVLTIGWVMGPAAVAIFVSARMLSRIPLQLAGLLTRASLPELTRSLVAGNDSLTERLMRANVGMTVAVMTPALALLAIWGPMLLTRLSGGEMTAGNLLFALLGLSALFSALWTTWGTRLMAMNRQSEYASLVLGLSLVVTMVPFVAKDDLLAVAAAMVVAEGAIAVRLFTRRNSA